ncbi:unannotated protein [freshwater metagenome]|uniref:Unannotated protein n=1 Tax=freshwater metagenome TaxID=449393 RepID=A0A6J6KR96_9ZZZZ
MSPRNITVGPGLSPVSIAAIPLVVVCSVMSSGKPSSACNTASRVFGKSRPISGHVCNSRRSLRASSNIADDCSRRPVVPPCRSDAGSVVALVAILQW